MARMSELSFKTDMDFTYDSPRELVPGVVRIVANNPSVFTFKGTNTYVIGTNELCVVDPGPDDEAHFKAIMTYAGKRPISTIAVTHTHRDHIDGLDRLVAATGARVCGFGRTAENAGAAGAHPRTTEYIEESFIPEQTLRDGDRISGPGWTLEALYTPGHAPDHLCFALVAANVLFSGDHVMGWNTTVVAPPEGNMAEYMASLEKLIGRPETVFFPGHGGRINEPQRMVRGYMVHRQWREQAILGAIRDGHTTISEVVALVYKGLDERLINAASLSVQAHVDHLIEKQLVKSAGPTSFTSRLEAV
jgi:glyoxylase-like metal-dependent hydrolase (beta-lactamase superfamily II)